MRYTDAEKVDDQRVFNFLQKIEWPKGRRMDWVVHVDVLKVALARIAELEKQDA